MPPPGRFSLPWEQQKILEFPSWLEGCWQVTSTNSGFAAPQGPKFVPQDVQEMAKQEVGSSVQYSLRFARAEQATAGLASGAVLSDRAANIKSVTNAFQGYEAIESVDYNPVADAGRLTARFGTVAPDGTALPPQRIELYVNHSESREGVDADGRPAFFTSELFRQVFVGVRRVEVNDYELVMSFALLPDGTVAAHQRSILYLQPQDAAYFDAGGRAVAYYDYDLSMAHPAEAAAAS